MWKKITTVTYMSKIFEDSQNINMTSWPVQFAFNLLKLFHNILGLLEYISALYKALNEL